MSELLVTARAAGGWLRGAPEPTVASVLGEDLAWAESVVAAAACRMVITVAPIEGTAIHRLWVRPDGVLCVLSAPNDQAELRVGAAQFTPDLMADLVGLRVRPRLDEAVVAVADASLPARLLAGPSEERSASVAGVSDAVREVWPGLAEALAEDRWQAWSVMSTYRTSVGEHVTVLTVLDSAVGLVMIEPDEDGWVLRPSNPTELWLQLVQLLPDAEDLVVPAPSEST